MDAAPGAAQKPHRPSRNKPKKKGKKTNAAAKQAVAKPGAFARRIRLTADRSEKRASNPALPVDRTGGDAAPRVVAVVGPSSVGKSTIIRNLVKHYSKRNIPTITGPITIVAGRRKRITFLEVGDDFSSMIDAAKVADLVLLVIDASFGFEMETFEFLNIAAAHGMPKIMAVLTHLDKMRDGKQVRKAKKSFKDRIWAELYDGAKVFYLSGITTTGDYLSREILNLARFISVSKHANIRWRSDHPYVLADRVEDITPKSMPAEADRSVAAYGYVRGTPLRLRAGEWTVHLAGVGDLVAKNIELLPDPCPAPELHEGNAQNGIDGGSDGQPKRKRKVTERERVVYAPMAPEVDGISYDRDAIYINVAPESIRFSEKSSLVATGDREAVDQPLDGEESSDGEGEKMVKHLQKTEPAAVDESLKKSTLRLVQGGKQIVSENFTDGRHRRRVHFANDDEPGAAKAELDSDGEGGNDSESGSEDKSGKDSDGDSANENEDEHMNKSESDSESGSSLEEAESDGGTASLHDSGNSKSFTEQRYDVKTTSAIDFPSKKDSGRSTAPEEDNNPDNEESEEPSSESDTSENSDDIEEVAAQRWKNSTLENASRRFQRSSSPSKVLMRYIYGTQKDSGGVSQQNGQDSSGENALGKNDDSSDEEAFFTPKRKRVPPGGIQSNHFAPAVMDDITRMLPETARDWLSDKEMCATLRRRRFGTGQKKTRAVQGDGGESDDSGPLDGDFEDLETGEVHHAEKSTQGTDQLEGGESDSDNDLEAIRAAKIKRKEAFDTEWDQRGKRTDEDDEGDHPSGDNNQNGKQNRTGKSQRDDTANAKDTMIAERDRLEKLKNETFGGLGQEERRMLEGILPGQYVRFEVLNVPVQFVKYFDPNYPVIFGGLKGSDDEGKSFLRATVRRHRFKRGVLKSRDPVIFSIGWRRFQSVPIYDTEDQGGRRRFLKYTPEYLHCNATFWGPRVAPGAGIIMCQSLARNKAGFRIAASGRVTEMNTTFDIVKKLKLIGEPFKVHRNTAFIKGMFNSELEVSKYIGAVIRTVSGIRGTIKKAISETAQRGSLDRDIAKSPVGSFRAGFEDKILLSDIVFLRAWVPVEPPKIFKIAATLLDKERSGNGTWRMPTIREIREANQLPIPQNKDSYYNPIERVAPKFAPLKLSRKLESSLPYASKPKNFAAKKKHKDAPERKAAVVSERAVVLEQKERKEERLLQAVYTIRNERSKRRKESNARRLERRKKELEKEEAKHAKTTAERRKRKFALDGARDGRESKRGRGEDDD